MTRIPSAEMHVGYDVVCRVHPSSYVVEEDHRGQAWGFEMDDDARRGLADAVGRAFDDATPSEVAVEPGYVGARFRSLTHREATGTALLDDLRDAAEIYNRRAPDGQEVRFHRDAYAGTVPLDDAPDTEEIRERFVDRADPATPDGDGEDGEVWSYTREDAGEVALAPDRRLAIRAFMPFDTAAMYDPAPSRSATARSLPVVWAPEVRDHLQAVVEDLIPWPGSPRTEIPRVAVYPTHAEVDIYRDVAVNPAAVAGKARDAFVRYNRHPPLDERAAAGTTMKHPGLAFDGAPVVVGLDTGTGADDWIQAHDLDAVDGEPVEPEPDDDGQDDDADAAGALDGLNPFSG